MEQFSGRIEELASLKNEISSKKSSICCIYGRRRVGKSYLIREATKNYKCLSFEGLENQGKSHQISNFLSQLAFQSNIEQLGPPSKNWRNAFMKLIPLAKKNPSLVIILDEFQWTANYRSQIISDLKMVWDQYLSQMGSVTLILCGSIASFMIQKVIGSSALFGRADLVIHLKPFVLSESVSMLKKKSIDEILETQMLVGGVPKYFELLQKFSSTYLGIQNLAFSPNGYFFEEYNRIFTSHFGRNHEFVQIVEALSKYPYGLRRSDIYELTGIQLGGGLTKQLYDLEMAGFIQSYRPFNKNKKTKEVIYSLKDAYLRFYFSFILPNQRKIESGIEDIFLRLSQAPSYYTWLGRAFEYLCMDHAKKISQILGFSGIDYSFGPYFKKSKKKEGIQIDLLFDRADRVITLCEIKYTKTPPSINLIEETERKVSLFQNHTKKTIQKVLITKTSPSQGLVNSGYFYKIIQACDLV